MKDKIINILVKNSIDIKVIDDIIIKNDSVIIVIYDDNNKENQQKFEKIVKFCEKDIKNLTKLEKIAIIFTNKKITENSKISTKKYTKINALGQEVLPVKNVKKIIAIASTKGGVGKSTIASNMAIMLQKMGYKTALVDADIYGPSIAYLMNLKGKPEIINNKIIPHISYSVKTISVASLIDEDKAGAWRGPMITKILHQLITACNWGYDGFDVDFMIIDMPPGTGDIYISAMQQFLIDGAVLVSTPQNIAIIDVVRSIDCFNNLQIPIIGIIQNMSFLAIGQEKKYIFGRDKVKEMAEKFKINFLGELPIIEEISNQNDINIPFILQEKNIENIENFKKIVTKVID